MGSCSSAKISVHTVFFFFFSSQLGSVDFYSILLAGWCSCALREERWWWSLVWLLVLTRRLHRSKPLALCLDTMLPSISPSSVVLTSASSHSFPVVPFAVAHSHRLPRRKCVPLPALEQLQNVWRTPRRLAASSLPAQLLHQSSVASTNLCPRVQNLCTNSHMDYSQGSAIDVVL